MNRFATMTLAAACACAAFGQGGGGGRGGPVTTASAVKQAYAAIKNNITQAAEQMPEAGYGFMPEGEPRSFAGWVGHVADAQARTCSGISGTQLQLGAAQMTTKADLVAAVKKSFDACDPVFDAITDANAMEPVAGGFGGMQPRSVALYGMIVHSNECYGAMGVYMRLQKLTPPSSAGRGGGGGGGGRGGGGGGRGGGAPKQ
jgi:hypothetical protein